MKIDFNIRSALEGAVIGYLMGMTVFTIICYFVFVMVWKLPNLSVLWEAFKMGSAFSILFIFVMFLLGGTHKDLNEVME